MTQECREWIDDALDRLGVNRLRGPLMVQAVNGTRGWESAPISLREGYHLPRVSGKIRYYPVGQEGFDWLRDTLQAHGEDAFRLYLFLADF